MKEPKDYTSVVIASYIPSKLRAEMFLTSIESLLVTTKKLPVEIIIIDNGGDQKVTESLDFLVRAGEIQTYIRNANNMHFGFARNQGIATAHGNYLVIADNDIFYEEGWLEKCLAFLKAHPKEKYYATPIHYPTGGLKEKYTVGQVEFEGEKWDLNMRAGSNCFVIRRRDFDQVGNFMYHRIAGTRWTDKAVREGYLAAVTPVNMVKDLGLRQGYNLSEALPIKRNLRDGTEVIFNEDEYGR